MEDMQSSRQGIHFPKCGHAIHRYKSGTDTGTKQRQTRVQIRDRQGGGKSGTDTGTKQGRHGYKTETDTGTNQGQTRVQSRDRHGYKSGTDTGTKQGQTLVQISDRHGYKAGKTRVQSREDTGTNQYRHRYKAGTKL